MRNLFLLLIVLSVKTGFCQQSPILQYSNPIIAQSLPDPTVMRTKDRYFYLYATEDTRNLPIWKSRNLVDWEFVGTAFTDDTHPNFLQKGKLWAPDINYIKGKYVLYYTLSKSGEFESNGIGVAVSMRPEGPFQDKGRLFTSKEIGVKNSIDQFYFEEDGKKYLFWGGFNGIYGIELSKNGLKVKKGAKKFKIAGNGIEGTAVEKRNGYYYFFGSINHCCRGADSKYQIIYGRADNLFGPYLDRDGKSLLEVHQSLLIAGNDWVAGPGHQSRLITDDNGQDWIIYHGWLKKDIQKGRVVFLDKLNWVDGWPEIQYSEPSSSSERPIFTTTK